MLYPFDFQQKGVLDLQQQQISSFPSSFSNKNHFLVNNCSPQSVMDSGNFPSGGSTSNDTVGMAAESELLPVPPSLAGDYSPDQEHSIFRWIMGDVEDPTTGSLSKVLELGGGATVGTTAGATEYDFSGGGFGVLDHGFVGNEGFLAQTVNRSEKNSSLNNNSTSANNLVYPIGVVGHHESAFDSHLVMNMNQSVQNQNQNPTFFMPQGQNGLFVPPQTKRQNLGGLSSFSDTGQVQGQFHPPHQLQLLPHYVQQQQQQQQRGVMVGEKRKIGDENFDQQEIIDQLYKASELVQSGNNPVLVQGILARLNHQLSPIGKPFHRAAFYFKEALQLLVVSDTNILSRADSSPFNLIFKISAYKFFSEISPVLQFANFTCTQALIEEFDGFGRIHIVDFDIGYGGQWASLMQELAIRPGGAPALKITVLASPSTHDQLDLCLTRENLVQFASEINISFEFDILSIDCLNSSTWSLPFHTSDNEAVAVNLPISSLSNYQVPVPLVFRFVKQLCPRIIVSIDRGCDRTDLPFSSHVIHALQSYTNLLESFDAMNVNMDALQKIERFLVQPGIEKIVTGRFRHFEKTQHWRTLFLSSGFSPVTFSNFTESQADFVVKRTHVRGFQVEKRQSSLVLCWQQKELISVSAWRCLV